MKEWLCSRISAASQGWTLHKVYRVNERGRLIDDEGNVRLKPSDYNRAGSFITTLFVPYEPSLENK